MHQTHVQHQHLQEVDSCRCLQPLRPALSSVELRQMSQLHIQFEVCKLKLELKISIVRATTYLRSSSLFFAGDCLTIGGQRCLKCNTTYAYGGNNCVPFTHHRNASGQIDACKNNNAYKKPYCQTKDAGEKEFFYPKFKGRCPNCWWDECSNSCPVEDCSKCVFPFIYDNVTHHACTLHRNDFIPERTPWCAKSVDDEGRMMGRQICGENCPFEEGEDLI